jgi:hypothetical protein
MSVRSYINQARSSANENYLGFAGNPAASNGGYFNYASAGGANMAANLASHRMADGTGNNAPQSQPYIINITNASATTVTSFDVLGAFQYLNVNASIASFDVNGNLVFVNGVTISSGIANVTYQEFLYQSTVQPFSIGLTYIQSTNISAQITQSFVINTRDSNGNQALRTIVPTIDPYQFQTGIVAVKQLYSIDGFTKLTFSQVLGQAAFQLQLYPSQNINLSSGLAGAPVAQSYGSPNVVQGTPLRLTNG